MLLKLMAIIQIHMAAGHMCSPPHTPLYSCSLVDLSEFRKTTKKKQLILCFLFFSGYPFYLMDFDGC